ncbi:hypothetical protein RDABS01_022005 [Bienertia sinuspersici]
MKTPLSSLASKDCMFWWLNKTGVYCVKSGYWQAKLGGQWYIVALAWAAWFCRNKAIFAQPVQSSMWTAVGFVNYVKEYLEYAQRVFTRTSPGREDSNRFWKPPPHGWIKVNTNAHMKGENDASVGVVLRDENGDLIAAGVKLTKAFDVEMAEAEAIRYGMRLAKRLGYERIILESDALSSVQAIMANRSGRSPIYCIYEEITVEKSFFESFNINHVRRSGNTLAHCVARWSINDCIEYVWWGAFPQSFNILAEMDMK